MLTNVAARTFFVLKDTRTTPMVSAATLGVYIILGRVLASHWGYVGLALASPLENGLTTLVIIFLLARRLQSLHVSKLARDLLLFFVASLVAASGSWLVLHAMVSLPATLQLIASLLVGGSLYMAIIFWRDRNTATSLLEMAGAHVMITKLGLWRAAWLKGASS
jgi:peptidoglycan biosynthesis protein MviN/MurJ (putative lipid II flippase)